MTPAEQIRATMALLEAVAAPKDNAAVVDRLFDMEIDVPELDEGAGVKSILATLIAAAGMSLASGAQAADAVNDTACAAAIVVLSNVDHAKGQISSVAPARAAAEKLALRAGQNGLTGQAFESRFVTFTNKAKDWVEAGKEGELRDYAKKCVDALQSQPAQTTTSSSAREQEIERSNREWEAKNKAGTLTNGLMAQAQADGTIARSLMANGMAPQAKELLSKYMGNEPARQAFMRAYNGQR